MEKISVVIPKKDNDGQEYPAETIDRIEDTILLLTGGFSRSDITGKWKEKDTVYTDQSYKYDIVTDEKNIPELKLFIESTKVVLNQLSMYFEQSKVNVNFL
jgi:hypothetical protein